MPGSSVAVGARFVAAMHEPAPFGVSSRASASTSTPQPAGERERRLRRRALGIEGRAYRWSAPLGCAIRLLRCSAPDAHGEPSGRREALDGAVSDSGLRRSPWAMPVRERVGERDSDFGGSSSVPISTRKSEWAAMPAVPVRRGPRVRLRGGARDVTIGKPSASRLAW